MKLLNWINGYKSIITAVIMRIVESDYVTTLISDPNLYSLIQGIATILFAGSVMHHIKKDISK